MSTNSNDDRWLLPRRQTEFPARELLAEETLNGRREATFLVLAALFFVATSALVLLGTSRVIDLGALVPAFTLPVHVLIPLAALPFAISFVASTLVCELLGRRRASALVWVGFVATLALVGLMRAADLIDGGAAFGVSLAVAACYLVAHVLNLVVFDALRRRSRGRALFVRMNVAAVFGLAAGWAAFGAVLYFGAGTIVEPLAQDTIIALAIGAAAGSFACGFVLSVIAALVAHGLALALRVDYDLFFDQDDDSYDEPAFAPTPWAYAPPQPAPEQTAFAEGSVARKLPAAQIVEDDDDDVADVPRRARSMSIPPYSSAEMRFFSEGDAAHD